MDDNSPDLGGMTLTPPSCEEAPRAMTYEECMAQLMQYITAKPNDTSSEDGAANIKEVRNATETPPPKRPHYAVEVQHESSTSNMSPIKYTNQSELERPPKQAQPPRTRELEVKKLATQTHGKKIRRPGVWGLPTSN